MTLDGYDWDDLRVFLAVVREGSLSRAAKALGMSQPTVGRRLSTLEDTLGPLVERTAGGCVPTEHGAALVPLVEQMRGAADGIRRVVTSADRSLQGLVRVATGEMIGRVLARHAGSLVAKAPGLQLEVVVGMKEVNLVRGDADIALRSRRPTSDHLVARKLPPAPRAIYGSPAYISAHPEALDERRYEACRWIGLDSEANTPSTRFLAKKLKRPPELRFGATSLILEAIAAGAGLGVMGIIAGGDDPRLQRVSEPLDDVSIQGFIVMHSRSRRIPRVRFVADEISARLQELNASSAG